MLESMLHAGQKDDLVLGLADRLERTFATLDQDEALAWPGSPATCARSTRTPSGPWRTGKASSSLRRSP